MNTRTITSSKIKKFKQHLLNDEKSISTIDKYIRDITRFMDFAAGRSIDKSLIMEYKRKLEESYAITSANSMLAALNSFLKFNNWHDCCVKQFRIQQQGFCPEEKALTYEEYRRLVLSARAGGNERLTLMMQTICGTGIRISELEYITVESLARGEAVVNCKGKLRTVFIVKELREILMRYAKIQGIISGPIFVTREGKPLDRTNAWREMKELCQKAQVPETKVYPHNLRHLFAKTFYDLDKDIAKLAELLGHTSINTTRLYIMATETEYKQSMESMRIIVK